MNVNFLNGCHQAQENLLVKSEFCSSSSVDEPVLDEVLSEIELVVAHGVLLILDDWDCLELKCEWNSRKSQVMSEPPMKRILFLVEDNKLIFTWCQNHVDSNFIFVDEF